MVEEHAACEKCTSMIPAEAVRCPECGYEPSHRGRISSGLLMLVCLPVFGFSILAVIISLLLPFNGTDLSTAFFGVVFFGVFAAISGGGLYAVYKKQDMTATNSSFTS